MNGIDIENMFDNFLRQQKATFSKAALPSVDLLIQIAATYHRDKLNTVLNVAGGSLSDLKYNGAEFILDRIFKCDNLVTYEDSEGNIKTLLIDVTGNINEVENKEQEIKAKQRSLAQLGIDRALIVHWSLGTFNPRDFKSGYQISGEIVELLDSNQRFLNTIFI